MITRIFCRGTFAFGHCLFAGSQTKLTLLRSQLECDSAVILGHQEASRRSTGLYPWDSFTNTCLDLEACEWSEQKTKDRRERAEGSISSHQAHHWKQKTAFCKCFSLDTSYRRADSILISETNVNIMRIKKDSLSTLTTPKPKLNLTEINQAIKQIKV